MVRRGAFAVGVSVAVAACRTVGQPGSQPPPPLASEAIGTGRVEQPSRDNALEIDGGAGRPSTSAPPPRWGNVPESAGELFAAVDGRCNHLGVSLIENATFVHYGRNIWDGNFRPTR